MLLLLLACCLFRLAVAGPGVGIQCCKLALQANAYLDKSIPSDNYTCGQTYADELPPAPDLSVPTIWCQRNCPSYALSLANDINVWATPLFQYILPAVIFSMTIPRRLVLEPHRWFFNFRLNNMHDWPRALLSLIVAGLIVIIDTTLWVFMIMIAPGPFIFSGLLEVVLDYRVIRYLESSHISPGGIHQGLDTSQRVQLLTAILAGNLEITGVLANPQDELGDALNFDEWPEETEVHLRAMLACQYPFGAAVGAPILLYIGSFVYNLATLHNSEGDQDTARALAFGIWWMNIVHVAAISACLLASNNPSTAAAIVKKRRILVTFRRRLKLSKGRDQMEDQVQALLETWSSLPLSYRARYEPVWMWTRGKTKASWLRNTLAWRQNWFREKVELTMQSWIFLTFVAYFLVLFPGALALWIEYTTPSFGVGCRSLTILVYTGTQFVFVILSAWSHFKVAHEEGYWDSRPWLKCLRRKWVGLLVAIMALLPAWISALFSTFAGTLMQISGIYQNCYCASNGYWTFGPTSTVSLATDTEDDRQSSWHWKRAGYTALGFLACVTYLGWWSQRYLREKFIERVKNL